MQNNEEIKRTLRFNGIPQWQLAKAVGVSENTMNRLLRDKMPDDKFTTCNEAISRIIKEREKD